MRGAHPTAVSRVKLCAECALRLHRLRRLRSEQTEGKKQQERPVRAERSGSEVEAQANWPWLLRTDLEQTRYYN